MGKTLWQRWTEGTPKPIEYQFYDPLGIKIGGSITIDELDYRNLPFFVKEIREYKRPSLGAENTFTDYVLLARPVGKEDKWVRIRCFHLSSPGDGIPFQPVLLEQYDQLAYDNNADSDYQGLYNAVHDTNGKFDINTKDENVEFYRPQKAGGGFQLSSYKAEVNIISELIKEGVANAGLPGKPKITKENVEYWNYSRTAKDEANQDYEDYVFVELNSDNGWMLVWRGAELNPHRVVLM